MADRPRRATQSGKRVSAWTDYEGCRDSAIALHDRAEQDRVFGGHVAKEEMG